jgi:uncharacterized protein YndB with AHSA1/START domain
MTADGFTVTRFIAAPRELVWDAWTKPEHFSVWFGTEAVEVPLDSLVMDVRPGGRLAAVMLLPDGNRIDWEGEYRVVEHPERIEYVLSDQPLVPGLDPVVTTFTEVEGGTEVSLFQPGYGFSDEQIAATVAGYNSFYDALERVVATLV